MTTLTIRDPYNNTFEIDASARAFWENREGYTILPEPAAAPEPEPASPQDETDTPKTTKRAARAAQDAKERPDE